MTDELVTKPKRPLARRIFRWVIFMGIAAVVILFGVYLWSPWQFDWIKRKLPPAAPLTTIPPEIFGKGSKIAIVTAHPDDAEFYCAGSLKKWGDAGADIQLIVLTDGDKAYYLFEDYKRNRAIRQKEQNQAAQIWHGRPPIYLGFADGRTEVGEPEIRAIQRELERFNPSSILFFDHEYPPRLSHGDHRHAGECTAEAIKRMQWKGWMMRFSTQSPTYISDISDLWDEKVSLVKVHDSQFGNPAKGRVFDMIRSQAERDGKVGGFTLGEGFRAEFSPGK